MIKINGLEIRETIREYGLLWPDGEENWDLCEHEARDIAWMTEATLLRRTMFVSVTEVAE